MTSPTMTNDEVVADKDNAAQRLPFTFAKRHGVVLVRKDDRTALYFHDSPAPEIFAEVLRFSGSGLKYHQVSPEKLTEILAECYHNDSSEALQDAAGISDDLDLTSLADAVPVTEDLLEQSDDAPVIRLINALLTEAIKEGASDVHIETFESNLVVAGQGGWCSEGDFKFAENPRSIAGFQNQGNGKA